MRLKNSGLKRKLVLSNKSFVIKLSASRCKFAAIGS